MQTALLDSFVDGIIEKPEEFVHSLSSDKDELTRKVTKHLFDLVKKRISKAAGPLQELLVEGYDKEQIWGQIELQNKPLLKHLEKNVNELLKDPKSLQLIKEEKAKALQSKPAKGKEIKTTEDEGNSSKENEDGIGTEGEEDEEGFEEGEELDVEGFSEEDELEEGIAGNKSNEIEDEGDDDFFENDDIKRKVNDKFFDIDDMENFIEDAEEEEARQLDSENERLEEEEGEEEEEEEGLDGEDGEEPVRYQDFFSSEGADKEKDDGEFSYRKALFQDDDDSTKSSWQKQNAKLEEQIHKLEEQNISAKPWVLKGEVSSRDRPVNSLLEAALDFETATKPAPIITLETTSSLEDIIKKRIKEGTWDDVIRKKEIKKKFKPKVDMEAFQEKSKVGLGEVMEKEYMKQTMGVIEPDKLDENHKEIFDLFKKLCTKLDALSNFHYTPKPIIPDPTIKPNVPAIQMEEVAPISMSIANILAPEEVYRKKKKEFKSEAELTQEERKALRSQKKTAKRKREKQKESDRKLVAKLNPGLGNPYAKEKLLKTIQQDRNTKVVTTSSGDSTHTSAKLFKQLQEETQTKIKGEPAKKKQKKTLESSKLKL